MIEEVLEEIRRGRGTDFCERCVDAVDAHLIGREKPVRKVAA